jgi:hypothetical protein
VTLMQDCTYSMSSFNRNEGMPPNVTLKTDVLDLQYL